MLATLGLQANRVVAVDALVDAVWGDPAPGGAEHTLQQHVSALRKVLGSDALSTQSPGYVLHVGWTDVEAFEQAAVSGFDAAAGRRWADALASLDAALAHWRGPALADARATARLQAAAVRLDELRLTAVETRYEALLELGRARDVVAELEQLVAEHPLRERLRALLMLALYRSGRQADALGAYQSARRALVDELGIEPSAELRDLEQAILNQSPELDADAAERPATVFATFKADSGAGTSRVELPDGQRVLLMDGITLIGRDPGALVRLVDNRVSRRHAEIETSAGQCVVRDLGSTNGTTVNGAAITEQLLRDGDIVGIGGVDLRYHRLTP